MRLTFKILWTTVTSIMLLLLGTINLSITYAQDKDGNYEIVIDLKPDDVLFDVNNMKPGDWAPRTLEIINAGRKEFTYKMTAENKGSEKLFNELLLEIKDEEELLYNGKLKDFRNLSDRKLAAGEREQLDITVRFPEYLGNEFQGTDSQFVFIFVAEDILEETRPSDDDGGKPYNDRDDHKGQQDSKQVGNVIGGDGENQNGFSLPNTASNTFNTLLIGSVLLALGIFILVVKKFRLLFQKHD